MTNDAWLQEIGSEIKKLSDALTPGTRSYVRGLRDRAAVEAMAAWLAALDPVKVEEAMDQGQNVLATVGLVSRDAAKALIHALGYEVPEEEEG